jgi:hypothetical protein
MHDRASLISPPLFTGSRSRLKIFVRDLTEEQDKSKQKYRIQEHIPLPTTDFLLQTLIGSRHQSEIMQLLVFFLRVKQFYNTTRINCS